MVSEVLLLPEGPLSWASSRLRIYWLAEKWPEAEVVPPEGIKSWDGVKVLVTQQKSLKEPANEWYQECRERGIKVVWDVCDPMWWWMAAAFVMRDYVDIVVASTDELAALARKDLELPTICIPDRHKVEEYVVKKHVKTECPVLMWHGVAFNRSSLWTCAAELNRIYALRIPFKVVVVDNAPNKPCEALHLLDGFPAEYIPWSLDNFYSEVLPSADVGLVPDLPGSWGKLKSNNKKIAFHLSGIPTTDGTSVSQMRVLLQDVKLRRKLGARLRNEALERWNIERSVEEWRQLVRLLTARA